MTQTVVKLKSPKQLGPAVKRLGASMDRRIAKAMVRAARWGAAEVLRVSARTDPRPRARGTYERSWVVEKLPDGALLGNSARHAVQVEVGRRPGKLPPEEPIIDWMKAKGIDRKLKRKKGASISGRRLRSVALMIRRKIAKRGIKGRYVLKRAMPGIAGRVKVELRDAIKYVLSKAAKS